MDSPWVCELDLPNLTSMKLDRYALEGEFDPLSSLEMRGRSVGERLPWRPSLSQPAHIQGRKFPVSSFCDAVEYPPAHCSAIDRPSELLQRAAPQVVSRSDVRLRQRYAIQRISLIRRSLRSLLPSAPDLLLRVHRRARLANDSPQPARTNLQPSGLHRF